MFQFSHSTILPILASLITPALAQYTATYYVGSLPSSSQEGQSGYNSCGTSSSQDSKCQNVFVNGVDDFCLWGPQTTDSIGNVEESVVSYCLRDGYGTRLIPDGAITGAHFVKVVSDKVSYVQVTGVGDLTKLMVSAGDEGGELDPHSWTGLGNPQGGLVFTDAFSGSYEQTHEWTSFMSATTFCIRACRDGDNAAAYCQHIYDTLDCAFTVPGSMSDGFDSCEGEPTDEAPGVYSGSTFSQGDASTPAPHPAGATSACTTVATIGTGQAAAVVTTSAADSASAASNTASSSGQSVSVSASASASASSSGSASVSASSSSASASASASASISASTSASIRSSAASISASSTTTSRPAASSTTARTSSAAAATTSAASSGAGQVAAIPLAGLFAVVMGGLISALIGVLP